ncbi:hypothetical protein R1sor_027278 [Riccia sorocarpa]|uniref:F-box domain-containing protein n=1 Tax=Riccia sorocarpa TaxID=122646 RepID=A0ABD3GGW8_9MARC
MLNSLPDDVLHGVFEKLPFASLVRFRLVCKAWNELITSPEFARKNHPQKSVLTHFLNWKFTLFNSVWCIWEDHSLTFLRDKIESKHLDIVATDGGLLCFETENFGQLVVCNPVTKRWKVLQVPCRPGEKFYMPPPSVHMSLRSKRPLGDRRMMVGLVVNQGTGHYKLVVAALHEGANRTTLVYESMTGRWRRGAEVPDGKKFSDDDVISCNGRLYCLVKNPKDSRQFSVWRLLNYDVELDKWSDLPLPAETLVSFIKLVEHCGSVHLLVEERDSAWRNPRLLLYNIENASTSSSMRLTRKDIPKKFTSKLSDQALRPTFFESNALGQGNLIYVMESDTEAGSVVTILTVLDFSANSFCDLPELIIRRPRAASHGHLYRVSSSLSQNSEGTAEQKDV